MKYSQLVHMPRDVKHWLEQQLEAHGIDGVVYTKYFISLLQEDTVDNFLDYMPPAIDSKQKYYLKTLLDELCTKLQNVENKDISHLDSKSECKADDTLAMDPTNGFSYKLNNNLNCMEPIQPCLPPNSGWTRGLLHDSPSDTSQNKMDDYFAKLFYDNPAELFGLDFAWNKSDERKNGHETDRIDFYNKQNLLATECNERNAEIEKLIAKFDANIEDIWKTTSETDHAKYQTILSQNILPNPYIQYGSNLIWAFEENKVKEPEQEKTTVPQYKSSFSHWNKFSSPILTSANSGFDTMLSAFNMNFSNVQKWSGMDDCNGYGKGGNYVENIPKTYNTVEVSQNNQEEEDLLTSAKTHFRPIRAEEHAGSQTGTYADGTTFAISNDLEKVAFKRSESGTLYLEDADTPRKYMEYKEGNINNNNNNKGEWESDDSSVEEFVPKFRVRQNNEKCCQTDEIEEEQIVPSLIEADGDSVSYESEDDEFYFPGDDELAQNIINAIEEEVLEENNKDCNYNDKMEILEMSQFKTPEKKDCICRKAEDPNRKQEWSEIWNLETTCENCNSEKLSSKDKFRFREELSQEGEQLLMDLSCIQQMYSNSDWCDDDSTTASDLNDEEAQVEDVVGDGFGGDSLEFGKGTWWTWLISAEPVKNNFDLRSLWKEEKLQPILSENNENKLNEINERPLLADLIQKERKRRNSSSQKACELYLEGQCRRPHCRFAHCDSAIPCPFFADASCMKGESCPLSHGARRPLSL